MFGLVGEYIGVVVQFKDISERKSYEKALQEANTKLESLAKIDGLTQIPNRRFFDDMIQKEWLRMRRSKEPISLLMIDVDFFKLYNDSYGHTKGDECLKSVAGIISSCLKRPQDFAARFGGEEFVCVLPETDLNGAAIIATSILNAIRDCKIPHNHSKIEDIVTVSIGCACRRPELKDEVNELINEADQFLYKSKLAGRNRMTTQLTPMGDLTTINETR